MNCAGNVLLPVFKIISKLAAKHLFEGFLGFFQQALDCRVPNSQCDYAARRQGAEHLSELPTVIPGFVGVKALGVKQSRCVLVEHPEVDPSAEVFLEGIAPGGKSGCGDASGQQRPGNTFCAM